MCPVTSELKGFHPQQWLCLCLCLSACMYIRVSVNLCLLSVFLFKHTIGPFIRQTLPSALYQTSV